MGSEANITEGDTLDDDLADHARTTDGDISGVSICC